MNQDDLVAMIRNKDEYAFTRMYDMYSRSLFAVISGTVKDKDDAEAVLQETFVKAWINNDSYNPENGRFFTWILTIARTTAKDKMRSKDLNGAGKIHSSDNFVNLLDHNNRTANMIDVIGIGEFVKKLKPKCIQIIELLFFKGYSQHEASEVLDIPVQSVKQQNRHCINDLRNYLQL